jgi:ribosomal protein L11 methyltransferase
MFSECRRRLPVDWMELRIDTITEGCDLAANILYDAGAAGVVIEDPEDARALLRQRESWDYIEPGALNTEGDVVIVKGYLPVNNSLGDLVKMVRERLSALAASRPDLGPLELATGTVNDQDWAECWKKYYKPLRIGRNIVIKPSWEDYRPKEGDIVVAIDPGMAFGTGTHESTALCIELLEKYISKGSRVIDVGCGSGILSVVAAKLGAGVVEAYDLQVEAVDITRENARRNGVDRVVKAQRANLLDAAKDRVDIIVSNIVADVIIKMSPQAARHLKPGGIFIASGIIRERRREVYTSLEYYGMTVVEEKRRGEWVALAAMLKG